MRGYLPGYAGPARWARASRGSEAETSLADMCGSDSRDIGGFPIERFRDAIQPNNELIWGRDAGNETRFDAFLLQVHTGVAPR